MERRFAQVDVFAPHALTGNPLAVVVDGDGLSDDEMQQFANWTNLSETTFLVAPTDPAADYRVRIFTPREELPFAGHPTLGTCQVWLDNGGTPRNDGVVIQECGVGLVTLSLDGGRAAFAAPPLLRGGPTDNELVERLAAALRIDVADIVDSEWIDNGPRWVGVLLDSAEAVLAIEPDPVAMGDLHVGVVGPHPEGSDVALELRAFFHNGGGIAEDPVTGSLNASVAQWMLRTGRISSPYLARQGTALGRNGRVHVHEADGEVWVGGDVVTIVAGTVDL